MTVLIETLKNMRDIGNTLIVVEHDEDTMLAADYLIDIGPGAGVHGGEIISAGTPEEVMNDPNSLNRTISCQGKNLFLFRLNGESLMDGILKLKVQRKII